MKKHLICAVLAAVLFLLPALPAQATSSIPESRLLPRLVDRAGLLTDAQESELLEKLDEISERQACDVVIVTVYSLNGATASAFADDFYDYNGYGMGEQADGILLLIGMEDRDWAISTCGRAISTFTDAGQQYMADRFLPDLSDGDYFSAFTQYAGLCDTFLTQAQTGEPYDTGNLPKEPLPLYWIALAILIGGICALIVTGCMRAKLKTVRPQSASPNYVRPDGLRLTDSRDLFLYSRVDRRPIPRDNGNGGGSRGSSVHTGSSGRSHGGSSGKF